VRAICIIAALLAVPLTARAQSALGPIGLPLPSIGLPLPSIGLSPAPTEAWRPAAGPGPERPGQHRPRRHQPAVVYFMPAYPWVTPQYQTAAPSVPLPMPPPPAPATGRLRLEVEPSDHLQLFVDGVYIGTPADLGAEIDLPPGSPRIEIRAPGYKTLTFDVQIVAARTITYRGALDRDADAAPPAPPPAALPGSTTLYFIPGCYLGNVPPADVKLPAGCDLARLQTIVP
jgi:hypothetical protein